MIGLAAVLTPKPPPAPRCSIADCERPVRWNALCGSHYYRYLTYGDPEATLQREPTKGLTCKVDGCNRPGRIVRGLCVMHYERARKGKDLSAPPGARSREGADPEFRFWSHVDPASKEDELGCWTWIGSVWRGYGKFRIQGKTVLAHRYAYELLVGPIPPERPVLDHLCRTTRCVNPNHLEPVTSAENSRRGAAARTECKNGHSRAEHSYINASGEVTCRACRNARTRRL